MAKIRLENVRKVFNGEIVALDNITLEVAEKEFMVVVGPTGCGKTTLLRLIAGLEVPSAGTITIDDIPVNNIAAKNRNIAMVFQNYSLYPHMNVRQNMAFALKMQKLPRGMIKQRIKQMAEMLGIKDLLNRRPRTLSGGQRQRAALARAIVRNPRLFLFDEPLSNLDAKERTRTRAELKSLQRRLQTTTIYVTHDQAEAMSLADRICVMFNGIIQQVAEPMQVYDKPVNRFVAGFIGTPAMNFFDGTISVENNCVAFVHGPVRIPLPKTAETAVLGYNNKQMVLGIRPEHFSTLPNAFVSSTHITATAKIIEPLGNRTLVHFESPGGSQFAVEFGPHPTITPEDVVRLYINTEKLHLFEPGEMGKNVLLE